MGIIGRDHELRLIGKHLQAGVIVALTGPSGIGKTTVAQEFVRTYPRGCVSVDCFGLGSPDAAGGLIAATGSIPQRGTGEDRWVHAGELLSAHGIELVFLDDVSFDFDELGPLLRTWSGRILTTSHAAPSSAFVLPVAPVATDVEDFRTSDAFRIFESSGQLEDLSFEVSARDVDVVRTIVRDLDGHPLAISLAGRRAATTSVRTVAGLIAQGHVVADPRQPERHQSHWAAIEFSWNGLVAEDQRLLYSMALFERPLRVEALTKIHGATLIDTLDTIRRLVRRGIVGRGEFQRPLELFRKTATRRFPQDHPAAAEAVMRRIEEAAIASAKSIPPGLSPLLDFAEEPSYWRIVVDRDCAGLERDDAARVVAAWLRYTAVRQSAVGATDSDRIRRLAEQIDHSDVWLQAARTLTVVDSMQAFELAERAVDVARTDRARHDASVFKSLCLSQVFRLDEAVALFDETFDVRYDTHATISIEAELSLLSGDKERAATALARLDSLPGERPTFSVNMLVLKAWVADDPHVADAYYRKAFDQARAQGMLSIYAHLLATHALIVATRFGRLEEALEELRESRELCRKLGSAPGVARAWIEEASVRLHFGAYAEAERISRIPTAEEAGVFARNADLIWAAALWQQGKDALLSKHWPRIRAVHAADARGYFESLWRCIDVGSCPTDVLDDCEARHLGELKDRKIELLVQAIATCRRMADHASFAEVLRVWPAIEGALSLDDHDLGVRQAVLFLQRMMPQSVARLSVLRHVDAAVVILHDFTGVRADGVWHDLTRLDVAARLLAALAGAQHPLDHDALGEALYADEFVHPDALHNRISVQVSKLRKAGLKPYLLKKAEGFVLEGDWVLEDEPPAPPGD